MLYMTRRPLRGTIKRERHLKAYYLEAASAFPDPGTPRTRKEWLWSKTRFGSVLLARQPKLAASADPQHKILGNLTLIPATERHRLATD